MFGSLGNMAGLFSKAREMQQQMAAMQERLANTVYDASVGGGLVTAKVNGKLEIVELVIEDEARDDPEMLPDLICAAVNTALGKAQDAAKQEMSNLTGGLNIPGMDEMLKSLQQK